MSLPDTIAKMDQVLEGLRAIEAIEIPATIKGAAAENWEGADELLLEMALLYELLDQSKDKQRVVPVRVVLSILAEFEEKLVAELIQDPAQLIWAKLQGPLEAGKYFFTHLDEIWTAIKEAFESGTILEFLFNYLLEIITLAAIKALAKKAFVARDGITKKLRSRAFPQSTGPRYWRKAVATK